MRKLLSIKIFSFLIILFFLSGTYANANPNPAPLENTLYQDKTKVVAQQIDLLKERLAQAQNELSKLQRERDQRDFISPAQVNKVLLNQVRLDIGLAKSNLDSINLELSEAQQTVGRLEKEQQELENQLNVYNMFGLKVARTSLPNIADLNMEMAYQKETLKLEKIRVEYLQNLQAASQNALQLYKGKFAFISSILKSQRILQLKERQAKSELHFQQQQSYWLQQLNSLYAQLDRVHSERRFDKSGYVSLENQIFYANENVNLSYLQMLIARYQDQLQQFKVSTAHSSSITVLNKVNEQMLLLEKQLLRVSELLKTRIQSLKSRQTLLAQVKNGVQKEYRRGLEKLMQEYEVSAAQVVQLTQQLGIFRVTLNKALKQELSARQGLPGLGAKAWLDLGAEILIVPSLTFQVVKSLTYNIIDGLQSFGYGAWIFLFLLEVLWIGAFYGLRHFLERIVQGMPDHLYGHINLTWLFIKLLHRNLTDIAVIGNAAWLFYFCNVPVQNFMALVNLGLVWLFFKSLLTVARLCLVETVHDQAGHDVRLYHRLKWSFIVGGVITAVTVFIHQLPLIYEVKDLFDRLFLFFLLVVSIFLLKSWEVLPGLILPHLDDRHTYVKRIVRLLGLALPIILFTNSAIGLFGYVNLVMTMSWYESVFLLVFIGYQQFDNT